MHALEYTPKHTLPPSSTYITYTYIHFKFQCDAIPLETGSQALCCLYLCVCVCVCVCVCLPACPGFLLCAYSSLLSVTVNLKSNNPPTPLP